MASDLFIAAYNAAEFGRKIELHRAWFEKRDVLRETVLNDLELFLTDATKPNLRSVEITLRRERVESMVATNLFGGYKVDFDLIARADRAGLPPEDRGRIDGLLEEYEAERDAIYRRVEFDLRRLFFEVQLAGRNSLRDEAAAIAFRRGWDDIREYRPLFTESIERADARITQVLSPEGRTAWRMAANQNLDPGVFGESPVDRVKKSLPDAVAILEDDVRSRIQDVINRFEEHRGELRVAILRADHEWVKSGNAQRAHEERDALLRQSHEEKNPTIDFNAPFLDKPRIPLVNNLLEIELKTLRELDALIPAEIQNVMPVEARVLLRWGRLAPER